MVFDNRKKKSYVTMTHKYTRITLYNQVHYQLRIIVILPNLLISTLPNHLNSNVSKDY